MDALENHPSKIKKMRYKLIKPIQPKKNQVRVPHPHPPIQPQSKKKSLYSSMNIKDMNKTMFVYFTELTTFLRDTTGLVVSYVKGLLFGDPFITETPVHIQEDNETPVHIQPIVTVTETTSALDGNRTNRFNSILFRYMEQHPMKYSEELILAMATASEQVDDCDFCSMFSRWVLIFKGVSEIDD